MTAVDLVRFQQQFPDWAPSKQFNPLHSMMTSDNNGRIFSNQ